MAKILIVAAMEKELAPFAAMHGVSETCPQEVCGHEVYMAFTGVGVVAATYNISRMIEELLPDIVVQAGICGAYPESGLAVGEVVAVDKERLADLGVVYEDGLRSVFEEDVALANPGLYPGLKRVSGNTVSAACSPLVKAGGASVESMEGYGLFFVCLRKGVDFAEMRSVSNMVSTDRSSWDMALAVENLAAELTCFIENY